MSELTVLQIWEHYFHLNKYYRNYVKQKNAFFGISKYRLTERTLKNCYTQSGYCHRAICILHLPPVDHTMYTSTK